MYSKSTFAISLAILLSLNFQAHAQLNTLTAVKANPDQTPRAQGEWLRYGGQPLYVDPTTGRLLVDIGTAAGGSGGDVNVTNIPTVSLQSGTSASLSVDSPLPIVGAQGHFNFRIDRATTPTGVAVGYVLSPVIQLDNVAISATNHVTLHNFVFFSGDDTTTNDFRLHICSAPITWSATNTAFNAVAAELGTNLIYTIESSDSNMGRWYDVGQTNRAWRSYGLGILAKPATNSLFLYFENASPITNYNPAWGSISLFKN